MNGSPAAAVEISAQKQGLTPVERTVGPPSAGAGRERAEADAKFSRLLETIASSMRDNRLDEALRYADRAGRLAPSDAAVGALRGRLLTAIGEAAVGAALLAQSAQKRPSCDTSVWLIDALAGCGRAADAVTRLAEALHAFAAEPGGALAKRAGRLLAAEAEHWPGWIGITPALEVIGEVCLAAGVGVVELVSADGTFSLQHRITGEAGEILPFRFALPSLAAALPVAATIGQRPLIGTGFLYPPAFALDGRAVFEDGRIAGWACLGWAPMRLHELVLSDDQDRQVRIKTEADPSDPDRRRFSVDPYGIGLFGNKITVSAVLPDGNIEPLPDAPLFIEAPPAPQPSAPTGRRRLPRKRRKLAPRRAAIVIPIYRGAEESLACLRSVIDTVGGGASITVIDDASPDEPLRAAVEELAATGAITLLRNAENLGFPSSVNKGLAFHADEDVVLLNADTVVFGDWLTRLRAAAYAAPDIGTVTPLSNQGSIVSYPAGGADVSADEAAAIDRLAAHLPRPDDVALPTGVGFCLYIRRDCLAEIGLFDDEIFAKGYGEENDFCLRAARNGWRHAVAGNVFVYHRGGRSFGTRQAALRERNSRLLALRYPSYETAVADFHTSDPLHATRRALDEARLRAAGGEHVLMVTLALSGGVARFVEERAAALGAEGAAPLIVKPDPERPGHCRLSTTLDLRDLRYAMPDELGQLKALLDGLTLRRIELHHFLGHDASLVEALLGLGVPCDVYVHDNGWICPRLTLVSGDGRYCGEPDEAGCGVCLDRYGTSGGDPISTPELRQRSGRWLARARTVVAPSHDMAQRMGRYFPHVVAQTRPWETELAPLPVPRAARSTKRIAVIGAIGEHKGYGILLACAEDAAARSLPLEFVVIGYTQDDDALLDTGKVFVTGRYDDAEIAELLRREAPDVAFFPSITPESWCYALSHGLAAQLPIVAFDLGAIAERLRSAGCGRLVPMTMDSAEINDVLLNEAGARPQERDLSAETSAAPGKAPKPEQSASPAVDEQPSASVQVITVPAGLYAFRVRSGTPSRPSGPEGMLLPAVNVGLVPGQSNELVEYLPAPGTDGNWLCEPGHTVVARVVNRPVSFLLTSLRRADGPLLSIMIDRLDLPNQDVGAGAQRLELATEQTTIDASSLRRERKAEAAAAVEDRADADGVRHTITAHIQRWGDTEFTDVPWAGHIGQRMWIEAFSVKPLEGIAPEQLEYKGLTAAGYETPWVSNGSPCGTRGMAMPLVGFAVRVREGENAPAFDCEYSGTFLSGATIGPRRNGAPCFSTPEDPLEAIQLKIIRRNEPDAAPARRTGAAAKGAARRGEVR